MLMHDHDTPIQTYKSYRAEKFEKNMQRQKALISGVNYSSLRSEDKKALLKKMLAIIENELNS